MTQIVRITIEQDNAPVGETTGLFVVRWAKSSGQMWREIVFLWLVFVSHTSVLRGHYITLTVQGSGNEKPESLIRSLSKVLRVIH